MNVLQVVPELNAGGVEGAGGRMEDELLRMGGILHKTDIGSKNIFTVFRRIRLLRALIHAHKIDIVHARSRAPAWPAYHAARIEGVPFLTTYHGIYNSGSALKTYYNSVMTKGQHIIANSDFTKAHIIKTHGIAADKITAIARGVDMAKFDPNLFTEKDKTAQRYHWRVASNKKLILLPGRLTRWKGQIEAIHALKELPEECMLVLLGDAQGRDEYVKELKYYAQDCGVQDRVIMPGHHRNMPKALAAADVVISASTDPEAFGRVAAEAQAMERPVVATSHGGAVESVKDGQTGFLVTPSDSKALAEGIRKALDWLDYDGSAARTRISTHFSTKNLQAKTLAVYKDLLK